MKAKIVATKEIISTHGGNLLIGGLLARTTLSERLNILSNGVIPTAGGISTGDVVRSYVGLLCQAQPEFEAVEQFRKDPYFAASLGLKHVPSCSTLRQRLDALGKNCQEQTVAIVLGEGCELLRTLHTQITPCHANYAALDIDVATRAPKRIGR